MQLKVEGNRGKIKAVAAAVGMVQALAWIILSFICIYHFFTSKPKSIIDVKSYRELLDLIMYALLFRDEPGPDFEVLELDGFFKNRSMTSQVFTAFMWIYLFLDVAWLVLSIYILLTDNPKMYTVWGYLTLAICFWDFITFVILGADYDKCLKESEKEGTEPSLLNKGLRQGICANTVLTVFLIAAKGITLWIVNILLGIAVVFMGKKPPEEGTVSAEN